MISNALITALLTTISSYTGYAIPGELPHIVPLPHDVLAQRVCGRPCPVFGFTLPSGEADYTTLERLWMRPTLDINGIWSGFQGDGSKTVTPARCSASCTWTAARPS